MSQDYNDYLTEHISNVAKGLDWLWQNIPGLDEAAMLEAQEHVKDHDQSKYGIEEYPAYDAYFYGKKTDEVKKAFDYAWLHHQHYNPHHWQHWILIEDDPDTGKNVRALEMPLSYIYEMIADWWSFSWKKENLMEIFKWYKSHQKTMVLGKKTRNVVNDILSKMKEILVMQAKRDGSYDEYDEIDILEHSDDEDKVKKYGVPEQDKFPMPDARHVRSAIKFFNYVDPQYEEELAEAIKRRAEEYGVDLSEMNIGDENRFKNYISKKDEYLSHHGILGQKWGQRNGPPYPLNEGDHSKNEQKQQGLQNLNGAKTANIDRWGSDEEHNTLYIAGYSGSGKSTAALAVKKPGDSIIHLDVYTEPDNEDQNSGFRDKEFNSYLDKHVSNWDALQKATKDGEGVYKRHSKEYWNKVDEFDKAIDSFSKEKYRNGERVIVEGVQIADNWLKGDSKDYAGKPIAILQNGPIKSMARAFERDDRGNLFQGLKNLDSAKEFAGWYYQMYNNLNTLADATGAKKRAYTFE